jgi:cyclic beta-1,2-glucan synthetase
MRILECILPEGRRPEVYKTEPYVISADIYSNPDHKGRGGWSFYTGSAAWYRKVALEILCGYTEERDGFYLKPRLSEKFSAFSIEINKKETSYRINVSLSDNPSLVLDGEAVTEGEDYFFRFDGGEHEAELKISL